MHFTSFDYVPMFRYGVIMADPPWLFENWSASGEGRNATQHYDCMPTGEIMDLPVGHIANKDCVLLLWGTSPMLLDALDVMTAWGFEYRGKAFCWAKQTKQAVRNPVMPISDNSNWRMNNGYSTRSNTEDCWLGVTGNPERLHKGVRELIVAPMREHSRKPDEAFERAQALYRGPYIELFSRQSRVGWDSFGNEATKFDEENLNDQAMVSQTT